MILTESQVFRTIDKLVHTDPDYWPTFQLRNVKILPHGKAKSRYARCVSLFDASIDHPVCAVGEIEQVDEDNLDRVLDAHQDHHDGLLVLLPEVTNFCYGEEDRVCKLWAEGQAGWFEIRPANDYQQIYYEMTEAVRIWYYLEDQYNIRGTRKARNPPVDILFEIYLKKHREYETVERVQETFHANQSFVLSEMNKQDAEMSDDYDETRMKWADTNIYDYFVGQASDAEVDTKANTNTSTDENGQSPESASSTPLSSSSSEEETEIVPPNPPKAGKSAKSAGLRPTGLTPKPARNKSFRSRTGLAMNIDSDEEETNPKGDVKRMTILNEMKKAGARTSFLEAFLEGRNGVV